MDLRMEGLWIDGPPVDGWVTRYPLCSKYRYYLGSVRIPKWFYHLLRRV